MDDDPLLGSGLRPITLAQQALFDSYLSCLRQPLSDYTFAQLFSWGNSLRIFWKEIRGHLCVFANGTGDLTLLMPPIGDTGSDAALAEAFELMDAYNRAHNADGRSRVEYVSDELLARFDRSRLAVEPMGPDYVYDTCRMIDLAGGDLASKRQLKNRFQRNYLHRFESYDPARHEEPCLRLLGLWKAQQDAHHTSDSATNRLKRHKESLACELAIRNARTLKLRGAVVYAATHSDRGTAETDLVLSGFTFGEALGPDQSSIIIEKTDLNVRGLAQFIFSEFCRACWADRPLVNAGDDWGIKSLAWTKNSYRPVRLLAKHALRLNRTVSVGFGQIPLRPATQSALHMMAAAFRPSVVEASSPFLPLTIRPARRQDVPGALALEDACFTKYCLSRRQLQYLQRRPSAIFLVAEQGQRIVGEGICLIRRMRNGITGRIYSLAVDQSFRRQKIGQKLLTEMLRELDSRGARRVYLEVEKSNTAAIELYQRNGFRSISDLPDYYGKGRPASHMMRELRPASGD